MWEFIRKKKGSGDQGTTGLESAGSRTFPSAIDEVDDQLGVSGLTKTVSETATGGRDDHDDVDSSSALKPDSGHPLSIRAMTKTLSADVDTSHSKEEGVVRVETRSSEIDHRKALLADIADLLSDDTTKPIGDVRRQLLANLSFLDDEEAPASDESELLDSTAHVSSYSVAGSTMTDRARSRVSLEALKRLSMVDDDRPEVRLLDTADEMSVACIGDSSAVSIAVERMPVHPLLPMAVNQIDPIVGEPRNGSQLTRVDVDSRLGSHSLPQAADTSDAAESTNDVDDECGGDALLNLVADQDATNVEPDTFMRLFVEKVEAQASSHVCDETSDSSAFEGNFNPLADPEYVTDQVAMDHLPDLNLTNGLVSPDPLPLVSLDGARGGVGDAVVESEEASSPQAPSIIETVVTSTTPRVRFGSLSMNQGTEGECFVFDVDPFRIRRAELDALLIWGAQNKAGDVFLQTGLPVLAGQAGRLIHLTRRVLDSNELSDLLNTWSKTNSAKLLSAEAIDFRHETKDSSGRRYVFRCAATQCQSRIPGDTGFALVCRVIPAETPSLTDLDVESEIVSASIPPDGMVLVTGPTGSGKSTLLGAILKNLLQTRPERVLTLEDPIEFDLLSIPNQKGMVMQCQIGRDYASFPSGITSFLRQKPNYILIGEARDRATIEGLCRASETGHGVYSTVHTRGVINTIPRMVDEYPVEVQWGMTVKLVDAMRLIVHQRLVPGTERGYVAIRSFLAFDQGLRDRLISGGQAGFIKTISEALENQGLPLLVDAEKKLKEGRIAQRTYDLLAATQSADNYH